MYLPPVVNSVWSAPVLRKKQTTTASKVEAARAREHLKLGQANYEETLKEHSEKVKRATESKRVRFPGGAMSIHADVTRAEEDFEAAAHGGLLTKSPITLQQLENGMWRMRTDRQRIPEKRMTCGLWAFFSVLAMSARELGLEGDPLVKHDPELVGMGQLAGMLERARARGQPLRPAGALDLLPVEYLTGSGWMVLQEDDGLFIGTAWIKCGNITKTHFIAYNAGTSVLHLGPWREVVAAEDKADPEMYMAQIRQTYGVYCSEANVVRRVMVNPRHPLCHQLSFNVPEQFAELPPPSRSRNRKRKHERAAARPSEHEAEHECDWSEGHASV